MVPVHLHRAGHVSSSGNRKKKHKRATLLAALAGAAAVAIHVSAHLDEEHIHTFAFTGQNWLDKLLKGNHCICV
jgi:hypothetical protein